MNLCENITCSFPFVNGTDSKIIEDYTDMYFWFGGVIICIISGLGVILNSIIISVFSHNTLKSTFHMFLIVLAVFDLGFSLLSMMVSILEINDINTQGTTYPDPKWDPSQLWIKIYPHFIHPFKYILISASECFTLVMSIDRFIAIKFPFRYHSFWTNDSQPEETHDVHDAQQIGSRQTRIKKSTIGVQIDWRRVSLYSIGSFFVSLCYCVPLFFEYEVSVENDKQVIQVANWYGEMYGLGYYLISDSIFRFFIPMSILLYTNIGIYKIAKRQSDVMFASAFKRKSQMLMLFGIVVVLMITHLYRFCGNMYITTIYFTQQAYVECCGRNLANEISYVVLSILFTINTTANFFIYLIASKKFRAAVTQVSFRCIQVVRANRCRYSL